MTQQATQQQTASAAASRELDVRLAESLVATKKIKLRQAIELVADAQRELLSARRQLRGATERLTIRDRSVLLSDPQ